MPFPILDKANKVPIATLMKWFLETTSILDSRSRDICPKCQNKNVANIVYGYPAKGWGAPAKDKKSYFHGCVLP